MKGLKVKEKLKKSLIVTIVTIMMAFMMPVRAKADIIEDFINLILRIPDGVMSIIDSFIGGSDEFTSVGLGLRGGYDKNGRLYNFIVTPYDIFSSGSYEEKNGTYYTKLGLLDINFFADRPITSDTWVSSQILAPVIGNVYKSLRNLAMVLMLIVVLYIGIKIMISSIAAQQAKYKQLLVDWLVGFALLFVMHYIMSGIVYLNSVVVKMLSNEEGDSYYVGFAELEDDVNASQKDYDSTWFDVAMGVANDTLDGDKYEKFKSTRLVVRNSTSETGTFSNVGSSGTNYIGSDGRLDLESVPRGSQSGSVLTWSKGYITYNNATFLPEYTWGDHGVIYLAASIVNAGHDNEKFENKAILRLNTMSYVRTISSYGLKTDENVKIYDNGGKKDITDAAVMGYSILYLCLVIETIMFTFTYIKRVLQMSFLTMVAPIVAIMYPVDKIGDGKAQAFNTWFKDYLFNILIQPMHLLLYTIFIVAAAQLVSRNIIYALAIYGFMIPSEKYFKKLLGFEKASTGGGGPLGGAIGRGLAMDSLGRLAGIGPAARGRGGSGGDGKGKSKIKTTKNDATRGAPAGSGGSDAPGAAGGTTGGNAGGLGSARAGSRSGSRSSSGSGNGPRRRTPNSGGAPERSFLGRGGHVLGKKISRAVTGGKYDYLNGRNGSFAEAGRYVLGRGLGRMLTRGAGVVLGGAVGITAGAAQAMTTGDINSLWKGAAVGAGAGNKLSSNLYDRGADFVEGFGQEMRQELANEDSDAGREMTQRIRNEEAFQKLDEDIYTMSESDRDDAIDTIEHYAQFVDFDSIKDVNAMTQIRGATINGNPVDEEEAVKLYKEAKGFDVATNRRAYLEKRMRDQINDPDYEDAINDVVRRHQEVVDARNTPVEPVTGTPAEKEAAKRRNRYRTDTKYQRAIDEYEAALKRSAIVEAAQGKMK